MTADIQKYFLKMTVCMDQIMKAARVHSYNNNDKT